MSQAEAAPDPVPTISPMAGFLSYLIPGLGQIVQGRISKGIFFMVVLLAMFHAGQAMGSWRNVYMPVVEQDPRDKVMRRSFNPLQAVYHRWHFIGQFFIGVSAWPAIWQFYEMPAPQGSEFWRTFQREPLSRDKELRMAERTGQRIDPGTISEEGALNRTIAAGNRDWDIGWIYTVVAGVLNILVIYDAVAGPAFGAARKPAAEEPQPEGAAS